MRVNWIVVKKFPLETDLTHITGFLRERAIEHRIYELAGEQVVAVLDPRMVAPIAHFLADVASGQLIISQDETPPEQAHSAFSRATDSLKPSAAAIAQLKATPVVAGLLLASILGALLVSFYPALNWMRAFSFQAIAQYTFVPLSESLRAGEVWRLVTPAFLHFGFSHLVFNSLWLWYLGRRLELLLGKKFFMLFFIVAAALSNIAQYLWAADTLFGGMSGVVYALVGFIAVRQRLSPHPLLAVPQALLGFMLFWLVLCMTGAVNFFIDGAVANAAHLGGLLVGCMCALFSSKYTAANN